ncbi:CPBP family intramembrane glutamic endopeptidase [Naasia sp. SYSU D00948]|uniref:CPBP family intramembrane glutamic endopeptidase n=1 Tax=Naasia sp. SYSU D00948 TaxID=2817379 RepID=UPI001B313635|nr:CPBP family intramembrane glutamic endopeptidase [Naasia sp. SYSU D00948]
MNKHVPARRGLHGIAQRHPIATLSVAGVGIAYAFASVWGLAYHGWISGEIIEGLGIHPQQVTAGVMMLALFPTAVYVTWASRGRDGVRDLFRRMLRWRVNPGWWITALVALPLLTAGIAVLAGDTLQPVDLPSTFVTQLLLLAETFLLINVFEEAVWAGVFQSTLERRHNLFAVAALSAVPFALVHLPLEFFMGVEVTLLGLAVAFAIYFVFGILVRSMYGTFLRATGDSILLVGLLHAVFNRTTGSDGIVAAFVEGDVRMLAQPIAVVLLTVTIAIVFRGRMTKEHRRLLDAQQVEERTTAPDLVSAAR